MSATQDPFGIADLAMELAVKLEADAADAYVQFSSSLDMDVRNSELEQLQQSQSAGIGLRVMSRGRTVLLHSTDLSSTMLLKLMQQALEMAKMLPEPKERARFAPAVPIAALPHPDPELRSEPIAAKRDRLIAVERAMLATSDSVIPSTTSYSETDGETVLVNTRGLRLYTPFTRVQISTECTAKRGDEAATGGYHVAVPSRAQLPSSEEIGRVAGQRATALLGAQSIPTTRAPVIFSPETGWAVFARLVPALGGDLVRRKRSFLGDQLGKTIAAPGVTLRDNALLLEGVGRRAFDGEGSPSTNLVLVDKGTLTSFLTDIASAEALGLPCGGDAVRESYDQQPQIGASNLYLEPGTMTPDEIIRATDRGLLVTILSGWWVGMSPTSDDFSSAAMGFWIEKGQIVHPVRGITIAGSLLEMLRGIDLIGNDLRFLESIRTPTFRVAEMAISGT